MTYVIAALAGAAAIGLLLLTIRRPTVGCAALVLTVPLTAGLARGSLVPVLKPNELILFIVLTGVVIHQMTQRNPRPVGALDLAVGGYVMASVAIPFLVILLTHYAADIDTWRTVLSPALFLIVYYVFSRTQLTDRSLRAILNCALLAGVLVCVIASAELANVPGVRSFIQAYYPAPALASYRPSSTLGHYSAVGAFGLLTYIVALALATTRSLLFPRWWLTVCMGAGALGIIVSETWAPLATLPVATIIILLYGRRVPRELVITIACGVLALAVLLPVLNTRFEQQHVVTAQGFVVPESMQTRIRYWNEFIIPALSDHLWYGTGTVIPSSVPDRLTVFVDNEYLWAGFRAGVPGIALLVAMLVVITGVGWAQRSNLNRLRSAIGAASVATAVMLLLLGATAQYITFAGLSQEIAMLVGVMAGLISQARPHTAPVVVIASREPRWIAVPRPFEPALVELRRLTPESGLLRSSAVVFVGFAAARALGFLFSVAAARILAPPEYGRLTYALAVITIASVFISVAPFGLSRFLARNQNDRSVQEKYFTNWVALIGLIVLISSAAVIPIAVLLGLAGWMLVGIICNFVGIAVLESYLEVQRGLDRYVAMMATYVIANLVQLLGILILASNGVRSPTAFLIIYGLSSIVALAVMQPMIPVSLRLLRQEIEWKRIREIFVFARPLLMQSVFFAVWFSGDLIIVRQLLWPDATGNYGAAKALVNVLLLAPAAIGTAILPRVARLGEGSVARYMLAALALTAVVTLPLVAGAALFGSRLIAILFGAKYPYAAQPVAILAVGMGLHGFYTVIRNILIGLGRPGIDAVASGAAMLCTVAIGLALVPRFGLVGAALAFTTGAAMRTAIIGTFAVWNLWTHQLHHVDTAPALQPQT